MGSIPRDQDTYVKRGPVPEVCEASLIDEGGELYISCIAGALFAWIVKRGANLRFVFCAFMLFFRCIASRRPADADPIGGRGMSDLVGFHAFLSLHSFTAAG